MGRVEHGKVIAGHRMYDDGLGAESLPAPCDACGMTKFVILRIEEQRLSSILFIWDELFNSAHRSARHGRRPLDLFDPGIGGQQVGGFVGLCDIVSVTFSCFANALRAAVSSEESAKNSLLPLNCCTGGRG